MAATSRAMPKSFAKCSALLMPLRDSMQAAYMEVPEPFNAAVERMLPMLRLMQHADGRLAVFQGVSRTCGGAVKAILERDKIGGRPVSKPHFRALHASPMATPPL
jgi:uncharacterized heparinase superfamily protein